MISLDELQTILLAAIVLYLGGVIASAGQDTWNWVREEFKKRRDK